MVRAAFGRDRALLRIAGTSHPEREWFRDLAEHHIQRALQFPA